MLVDVGGVICFHYDVNIPSGKRLHNYGKSHFLMSIPSGKRLHNYGKSHFFISKSTINGKSIAMLVYQRVLYFFNIQICVDSPN